MEKVAVYNQEGKEVQKVSLPESLFGVSFNADLLHQVVVAMRANARTPVAHTKDRSDVRGGGRKPWRQKGTGRARHGSTRSPLWRGGGATFGPRNVKRYAQKVNKKARTKALFIALSRKLRDGELIFLENLAFGTPKTAEAKRTLSTLSNAGFAPLTEKKRNAALIVLPEKDEAVERSFNNFGNIAVEEVRSLNALDVLTYKYIVFVQPEAVIALLSERQKGSRESALTPTAAQEAAAVKK